MDQSRGGHSRKGPGGRHTRLAESLLRRKEKKKQRCKEKRKIPMFFRAVQGLHSLSIFGDSQVKRLRNVWPAGLVDNDCKFTFLSGRHTDKMVNILNHTANIDYIFKIGEKTTSLVLCMGSVDCLQDKTRQTVRNICEIATTIKYNRPDLNVFICTVPIPSSAIVERNEVVYQHVEKVNAELRALFGSNDEFVLHKLGSIILLDIAKCLATEYERSQHYPTDCQINLWSDECHITNMAARIIYLKLARTTLFVAAGKVEQEETMHRDEQARSRAANLTESVQKFEEIGHGVLKGLLYNRNYAISLAIAKNEQYYFFYGRMRQIRSVDSKNKFGIYKDVPIRRARKIFRKDWTIEQFLNDPNLRLQAVQLSFDDSTGSIDVQNVVAEDKEDAQASAGNDNANDDVSLAGSAYSSASVPYTSEDEMNVVLEEGEIVDDSDKVGKRAWRSERPAVAPCRAAVAAADPAGPAAERTETVTPTTDYRKRLLSLANRISTTEGGMQMLKRMLSYQQAEKAQPEVARPTAQQCADEARTKKFLDKQTVVSHADTRVMQIRLEETREKAVEMQKTYSKEDQAFMERLRKRQDRFGQQTVTRTVVPSSCDEGSETILSKSQRKKDHDIMKVTTPTLDKMDDYERAAAARPPEPQPEVVPCFGPSAQGKLVVDQDEMLKAVIRTIDPADLENWPGATLIMRQELEFYYQKIANAADLYDPRGSLEPVLSLVNRQIFVAYDYWVKAFPGHCNVMWDRLVIRLKKLKHFEYASFVPRNYIGQAASIMNCDTTRFSLAVAWDVQRLKRDLLLSMRYNTRLPGHEAIERQANEWVREYVEVVMKFNQKKPAMDPTPESALPHLDPRLGLGSLRGPSARRLLPSGFAGGGLVRLHQVEIGEENDGGQPRQRKRRFEKKP